MNIKNSFVPVLGLLASTLSIAPIEPASAVVYCKTVGVPKGCVARVGAPVARRAVVTPGVGAAGVGVRAGTPMNRGGPVNRAGRR
ncbi:hypothetical protein IP69_06750 [Bosea sp. AAP35]|uniref:hypothetical protein n=1 Tax=Bosea sp. AAP35 TaxID=1523417 RepID=UPI0006B8B5DA|nr:hypothetical protein [Bosea sp. AAP35]KPF71379.1 hypothetical protein IP69_06750 [Bosea sp. AAP35]